MAQAIGLSNFNSVQITEILEKGKVKPANLQVEVHPYFSQEPLVAFCKERGIAVTAYSPLGTGAEIDVSEPTPTPTPTPTPAQPAPDIRPLCASDPPPSRSSGRAARSWAIQRSRRSARSTPPLNYWVSLFWPLTDSPRPVTQ